MSRPLRCSSSTTLKFFGSESASSRKLEDEKVEKLLKGCQKEKGNSISISPSPNHVLMKINKFCSLRRNVRIFGLPVFVSSSCCNIDGDPKLDDEIHRAFVYLWLHEGIEHKKPRKASNFYWFLLCSMHPHTLWALRLLTSSGRFPLEKLSPFFIRGKAFVSREENCNFYYFVIFISSCVKTFEILDLHFYSGESEEEREYFIILKNYFSTKLQARLRLKVSLGDWSRSEFVNNSYLNLSTKGTWHLKAFLTFARECFTRFKFIKNFA